MLKDWGFPPVFGNIITANMQSVFLLNEPASQYRFMNLSKTDDNDRTRKNDANTHLDI